MMGMMDVAAAQEENRDALQFFENNVRPVLTENCLKCHGPRKAESGLRLDTLAAALEGGDSGSALTPGNPDKSLLLTAIRHQDGLSMPPDGKLDDLSIVALERWITDGAIWPDALTAAGSTGPQLRSGPVTDDERHFWAYQPIADTPVPPLPPEQSIGNAIDRFILARLNASGLEMRSATTRRQLIRRATFDLTGLPPSPEQLNAFLADDSPDAFQTAIDRLLQSSSYGERWGRHWLDVVRYADTAGETADYPTPLSWKYRNWVIDAFNRDMPYDEFVRQQIAGDLMATRLVTERSDAVSEAELLQYKNMTTATGFIAISRRFGFDVENYHHLTIQDTIDTVGQAFLGLSLGCARCHDHKYDPVTAEDYYAWYGIFESTRYSFPGSEEKKRPYDLIPAVPPEIAQERQARHESDLAVLNKQLEQLEAKQEQLNEKLIARTGGLAFCGFEAQSVGQRPHESFGRFGFVTVDSTAQSPYQNVFPAGTRGLSAPSDANNNAFVRPIDPPHVPETTPYLYYNIDFRNKDTTTNGNGAYRFYLGHGPGNSAAVELGASAGTFFVRNGSTMEAIRHLIPGQWYNLQFKLNLQTRTFSGSIGTPGDIVAFENKAVSDGWDGTIDSTFVDKYGPGTGVLPAWQVDNLAVRTSPFLPVGHSENTDRAAAEFTEVTGAAAEIAGDIADVKQQRDRLTASGPYELLYGAVEGVTPADTALQLRGDILKRGDIVPRKNLEVLGDDPLGETQSSGRLQLAEWLTRRSNPLTARVMVNRIWQHHFGRGLVASENDFGTRGERPSHPELLDWLANRFIESGWSVKTMHRLIMASDVYQQSTEHNKEAAEIDPDSRLLWRFNRRRLSAEEIRDAMLFVSGDLDSSVGKEHPFPPVETWGFTQHSPYYATYPSKRRSVYLMQQRLKRHPFLSLFDGADTNASTARRQLTTVPTQALYLMNSPFVHERAASLSDRITQSADSLSAQVEAAYVRVLGRPPAPDELSESITFLKVYVDTLGNSETRPEKLALSGLARVLLTGNEFLFVD